MKRSLGDLDLWYKEHMMKRNSVPDVILGRGQRERLWPGDDEEDDHPGDIQRIPTLTLQPAHSPLTKPRKSLQENGSLLRTGHHVEKSPRRKSFDVAADSDRRPSVIGSLFNRIALPAMKKSDQKSGATTKDKGTSKLPSRASPLMGKKSILPQDTSTGGSTNSGATVSSGSQYDESTLTSSDDLLVDNGSDTGTDEVDAGEGSSRTKQVLDSLQAKIQKTKDAIRKEQNTKEAIVNEYLQMASDKQPTARIKALFEKKNQKSAMNIIQLQKKLENYQHRHAEVETHGYTGHKQAKEVLRDVGQGLNTIVSKPKEFAHLIKNKFGSADNIAQLSKFYVELDDPVAAEGNNDGKAGGTLPASFKYTSDDENSSVTSGSGLNPTHTSPHHNALGASHLVPVTASFLEPLHEEISEVRDSSRKVNDILLRLAEEFEEYKIQMQQEVTVLRSLLDDEKYKVEHLEEQLNDLTELHQNEMLNLKQDLTSMEEKIEYRLDERTTDLSDLVDNASTRISRLEQQQQQQQILSMEMVENATFRTIISKLINVVLAILAVILVLVSTAANFLSPFVHSTSRLVLSIIATILAWLIYQNYSSIEFITQSIWNFFTWPWS